jgi:hypothetical protein
MNALPTKTCVDCFVVLAVADFPVRDGGRRHDSRCAECRRRYWRNAHDRSRTRRGLVVGTRKPRVVDMSPSEPKGFVPPVDFLTMGEADRSAALVWSLGNRLPGPWDRVAA